MLPLGIVKQGIRFWRGYTNFPWLFLRPGKKNMSGMASTSLSGLTLHYRLTHPAQGLSTEQWPPEIPVFFPKLKGCTSSGSCQETQQVTWLLLRAPSWPLISLTSKQPRQAVIDNLLSHEACYLKCRVLRMIHQGNKVKVQRRQQQLIPGIQSWEGNHNWARMHIPSVPRNTNSYIFFSSTSNK